LVAFAVRENQPDPALVKALQDPIPVRRAVAAEVLAQGAGNRAYSHVRPLLKDPKPTVRMRAALALTGNHDGEAVPVLIDLVTDLPAEQRKKAEAFLHELAGEWAVSTPQGPDGVSGQLRRDLWRAWWASLDGPRVLDEFKKRTLSEGDRERVAGLIK